MAGVVETDNQSASSGSGSVSNLRESSSNSTQPSMTSLEDGPTISPPAPAAAVTGGQSSSSKEPGAASVSLPGKAPGSANQDAVTKAPVKRTPNDFIFGKTLGEGSFSTVYLAKEVSTGMEFAIKTCDKKHIMKEKKEEYIMREKTVLTKMNHPFIIRLYYTFHDANRLYFVLHYAVNGEVLYYLNKLASFDMKCTQFYAAEIVVALEYLQRNGIIHRDLKPENILLSEKMHIMITDFGSSKDLSEQATGKVSKGNSSGAGHRRNSFVGTAQYVSPEVLNSKTAYFSSDLWALGCIVFQFLSGETPFRGGHEYQIFQKVCRLDYEIPEGFNPTAADLVKKLLVLDPKERLGCGEMGGMDSMKQHPFFQGVTWQGMEHQQPPELVPYLPATERNPEFWSNQTRTGFDDRRLAEITISNINNEPHIELEISTGLAQEEHRQKVWQQEQSNEYHKLVEGNLILKQGKVLKRKGLFARKRMLLLTEGPHLYYVDYSTKEKVLKGQIPWSKSLRPEAKNFKIFFVHTPNRTYYLESRSSDAHDWETKINDVWQRYYGKPE